MVYTGASKSPAAGIRVRLPFLAYVSLAQWIERNPATVEVKGSNPLWDAYGGIAQPVGSAGLSSQRSRVQVPLSPLTALPVDPDASLRSLKKEFDSLLGLGAIR